MSYHQKEKAKTKKDKKLAVKHLKLTAKLATMKVKDHLKAAKSKGYTSTYNKAHAKDHAKEAKGAKKLMKAYAKSLKKGAK